MSESTPAAAIPPGYQRVVCWVLRPLLGDDLDPHYASRAEAAAEIEPPPGPGSVSEAAFLRQHPWVEQVPVELPEPCYVHDCDACGDGLRGGEYEHVVHWRHRGEAEGYAASVGWTSDGRAWHCPDCPELVDEAAEEAAARVPGARDQHLTGLSLTRADLVADGLLGSVPRQNALDLAGPAAAQDPGPADHVDDSSDGAADDGTDDGTGADDGWP